MGIIYKAWPKWVYMVLIFTHIQATMVKWQSMPFLTRYSNSLHDVLGSIPGDISFIFYYTSLGSITSTSINIIHEVIP